MTTADLRRARPVTHRPSTWLFFAVHAQALEPHQDRINELVRARHTVRIAYCAGALPPGMPKGQHRILTHPRIGKVPTQRVTRLVAGRLSVRQRVRLARHDRWLRHLAPQADEILLVEHGTSSTVRPWLAALAPQARIWEPGQVEAVLAEEVSWLHLLSEATGLDRLPEGREASLAELQRLARGVVHARQALGATQPRPDVGADAGTMLRRLAQRALRRGELEASQDVLQAAGLVFTDRGSCSEEVAALRAVQAHLDVARGAQPQGDPVALAAQLLVLADGALESEDVAHAAELGSVGLSLLSRAHLRTGAPALLAAGPGALLEPLRASKLGRLLLTGDPPRADRSGDAVAPPSMPLRVAMLTGEDRLRSAPLVGALLEDPRFDLTVIHPPSRLTSGAMDDRLLLHRLEQALGRASTADLGIEPSGASSLRSADVLLVDGAGATAAAASILAAPTSRLVVLVHGADLLAPVTQVVDWGRVDDIVVDDQHVRDLCVAVLQDRCAGSRLHQLAAAATEGLSRSFRHRSAGRTLGAVGWDRPDQDLLFALEVLSALLQQDDSWTLRLIGAGPSDPGAARPQGCALDQVRASSPLLQDHINYVSTGPGDVADAVADLDLLLATGRRGTFPGGTVPALAGGALPVIRRPDAFAPFGPASLPQGVPLFRSATEAAGYVSAHADHSDLRAAAERFRVVNQDWLDNLGRQARLLDIVAAEGLAP